jgi:hypothetical protein
MSSGRSRWAVARRRGCARLHGPEVLPAVSFLVLVAAVPGRQATVARAMSRCLQVVTLLPEAQCPAGKRNQRWSTQAFLGILRAGVVARPAAFDDSLVNPAAEFTDQTAVSGGWKVQGMQDFAGLP